MIDNNVISLIKSSKWKSFNKLYPIVKEKYPNINRKHLHSLIANNITHDVKPSTKLNSKYFNKVYSNHRHSYQMDIFVNDCKHTDITTFLYYLILINNNTRVVKLIHTTDKSIKSVLPALKTIIKKTKIKSIESDEESSFKSKEVLNILSKKDIDYYILTEQ
jgi:hypothetical protein